MIRPLAVAAVLLAAAGPAPAGEAGGPVPVLVDAREAGARGDGVHDDGPALQAALDRVAAAGGVLRLPPGVYAVGAPLRLAAGGVALRGEGAVVRAGAGFPADPPRALLATAPPAPGAPARLGISIAGLRLDGAGVAAEGVRLERVRDVAVRDTTVLGLGAGGAGAIVVRSADDAASDSGEIAVTDNVVELDGATPGIVLRKVVNCRVSGNRVRATGEAGAHGLDLTLSQGCTVADNVILSPDVGVLSDESNHLQITGNYVFAPRVGFRAGRRAGGRHPANNNVFVNNRVLTGGAGFVVLGSGMVLVANYAAFLEPGPAIWVQRGGTHDAVVANNPSVARLGGIRFDASDGVVAANVPVSNGGAGIEVNGERVAVTGNALGGNPVGIRLGTSAAGCTVVGNTVREAREAGLVLGGREHRVRDNAGEPGLPEAGPGAVYGAGEVEVRAARTAVAAAFPDDAYVVQVEWAGDPGGREWVAAKTAGGFELVLPAAPRAPVRARWLARGL